MGSPALSMHVSPTDARVAVEHGEDAPAGVLVCSLACAPSLFECLFLVCFVRVVSLCLVSRVCVCVSGELLL